MNVRSRLRALLERDSARRRRQARHSRLLADIASSTAASSFLLRGELLRDDPLDRSLILDLSALDDQLLVATLGMDPDLHLVIEPVAMKPVPIASGLRSSTSSVKCMIAGMSTAGVSWLPASVMVM